MNEALPVAGTLYRHYRNKQLYRVLGVARHSETLEDLVVYEALYENEVSKLWVRPLAMFVESVAFENATVPRFLLVEDA